jgi:hypothetical protein
VKAAPPAARRASARVRDATPESDDEKQRDYCDRQKRNDHTQTAKTGHAHVTSHKQKGKKV